MATINDNFYHILLYCGFNIRSNHKDITKDGFEVFKYVIFLTEKEMGNLSKGVSERTTGNGSIIFGLRQIDTLKATVH